MPTIKFPKNPNVDTAFVEQDDGTKNRALMIAPQDISTLELPNNPNSTKGYITVDGQKQRVILTADITGGGGGGSGLPDQTGHSGEFLTTDGTDASWGDVVKQHTIMYDGGDLPRPNQNWVDVLTFAGTKNGSTIYPAKIQLHDSGMVLWGSSSNFAVTISGNLIGSGTIGRNVFGAVQSWQKIFVNNISSGTKDISVPNTNGTMAVIQVNTTITLTAAGWSSNTQTVTVTGMTATGVVLVSPDPTDQADYTSGGVLCTAQGSGTLTFTCATTPTNDIDVNIVML